MSDLHPDAVQPFAITRESAPSYWQLDTLWTVLASSRTTGRALTVMDQEMPHRSGPPLHVHELWHEFFYLLDGEIRFQVGETVHETGAGTLLSIPPGHAHAFAVMSETARVLNIYTPGGFEEQIMATAAPAEGLVRPPDSSVGRRTPETQRAFAERSAQLVGQRLAVGVPDLLGDARKPFAP